MREEIKKTRFIALTALAIALVGNFSVFFSDNLDDQRTKQERRDNVILTCAITRLVAHVPAVQFEGEPTANFIGWIEARRDMLEAIRSREICEKDEPLLAERVKLDRLLLKEITG